MRVFILGVTVLAASSSGISAAAKPVKPPLTPKQGIKTPGVQIPFVNLSAEATLPAPQKPAWVYYMDDSPAGAGRGGRGAGGRAAGRGTAPEGAPVPPSAAGILYIPAGDKLEKIETKTNKSLPAIAGLKDPCGGMVSAFGSLWVPTCGDGSLQRLDPKTSKITASIASGAADIRGSIVATADSVWVLTDRHETLSRIDPDQNAVVAEIRLPSGCSGLVFGETSLWMACPEQNKVIRINPATNIIDKRIEVSARPLSLAFGEGSVWVLCGKDGKIDRIDPKTEKVTKTIDLMTPNVEGELAIGDGYLWATITGFPITRIDVTAETVAQQFWGEGGGAIRASPGALWLSHLSGPGAGTVWRVDPKLVLATLAE